MFRYVFLLLLLWSITACSDRSSGNVIFKKTDYVGKWPFSIEEINVVCDSKIKPEIYFKSKEHVYALNSMDQALLNKLTNTKNVETVNAILLDDSIHPGVKVAIPSEFINTAFEKCGLSVKYISGTMTEKDPADK